MMVKNEGTSSHDSFRYAIGGRRRRRRASPGRQPGHSTIELEIEFAARSDSKVLITGESGVGKEVIARLIHRSSRRA